MGFKAEEAVDKLEWDFRPYVDAFGVSPEPSGQALWLFQQNWVHTADAARRTAVSRAAVRDKEERGRTSEQVQEEIARWAGLTWDEAIEETSKMMSGTYAEVNSEELHRRMATLIDELTKGCPNTEQIMGLPGRNRAAFLGWFFGQVSDPEG